MVAVVRGDNGDKFWHIGQVCVILHSDRRGRIDREVALGRVFVLEISVQDDLSPKSPSLIRLVAKTTKAWEEDTVAGRVIRPRVLVFCICSPNK